MNSKTAKKRSLVRSLEEYLRGITGGLLFSLPLLYTMEVWWAGFIAHPLRLLIYVLVTFTLLLAYNRYCGLRCDATPVEVAIDSVEEMGLGLVIAAVMLFLLGQIELDISFSEIISKIIIEAMTVAIGVSVGTAQLGNSEEDEDKGMESDASRVGSEPMPFLGSDMSKFGGQLTIALCGAVLFAANVAPTEEIIMIAVESTPQKILALAIISMLLSAIILFYSNITGSQQFIKSRGIKTVFFGTVVTYAIALFVSAAILWFFGRFDNTALSICIAQVIVLGFAATLGASAGRLLLQ